MEFSIAQLREVVGRLTQDMPGVRARASDGIDADLQLVFSEQGGWSVVNVLCTAAACVLAKGLPVDHPDAQFVRTALENYGYRTAP